MKKMLLFVSILCLGVASSSHASDFQQNDRMAESMETRRNHCDEELIEETRETTPNTPAKFSVQDNRAGSSVHTPVEDTVQNVLSDILNQEDAAADSFHHTPVEAEVKNVLPEKTDPADISTEETAADKSVQDYPVENPVKHHLSENPVQSDSSAKSAGSWNPTWSIIWPGTKWCGPGNVAADFDDLGARADTDKCCRAHDLCDDVLLGHQSRGGLTNESPFTELSCKCDQDFYKCLKDVDTVTSNFILNLYFNILNRPCYIYDYPESKKCKKYNKLFKNTCEEYEKIISAPKVYQWRRAKIL